MLKKLQNKEKGFTLIEIVLVLAIAGLLIALVFVALNGAQKSRRDAARKNDAARMLAAIESCAGNNNGVYTNCLTGLQIITPGYFSGTSPTGVTYTIASPYTVNAFQVDSPGTCTGTTSTVSVKIGIEAGTVYCVDNH